MPHERVGGPRVGLFVISTDVGAVRDIICEGENGRIVRIKDHEHLAELMAWAAENIEKIRSRRARITGC